MARIAVSNDLIDEYLKYIFQDNFTPNKVKKLFRYIEPFNLRDTHPMMKDPSIPLMLENDPLIEVIAHCSDEDLTKQSSLKLMLVEKNINVTFTTLNILGINEKLDKRFGGTYNNSAGKSKAQKHIKSLLEDGKWIRVIDRYIMENTNQWDEYQDIFKNILPNKIIDVVFQSSPSLQNEHKSDLKKLFPEWKGIKGQNYDVRNTHDRYIETDKIKILLSSGIYHLSTNSNMDFTYLITLKG